MERRNCQESSLPLNFFLKAAEKSGIVGIGDDVVCGMLEEGLTTAGPQKPRLGLATLYAFLTSANRKVNRSSSAFFRLFPSYDASVFALRTRSRSRHNKNTNFSLSLSLAF